MLIVGVFINWIQSFQDWNDFYSDEQQVMDLLLQFHGNQQITNIPYSGNFYIHSSSFISLIGATYGGGLYHQTTSTSSQLLVESCLFFECIALKRGGGLYSDSNGHSVLHKVCGIQCEIQSTKLFDDGPFAQILSKQNSENINSAKDI